MKSTILTLLPVFFSLISIAQNKAMSKEPIDSTISRYESAGLDFYNKTNYDSAIGRYMKASVLLDSIYKKGNKFTDEIDLYVTNCNIGQCYGMKKNSFKAFKQINEAALLAQQMPQEFQRYHSLCAFVQFTIADVYIQIKQTAKAEDYYGTGVGNLNAILFSPYGVVHYKYGIKDYSYPKVCQNLGDMYKASGDSLRAKKYYDKVPGKK
jgi:tetratricopeptide (TPR) repeat protein